MAQNIAAFGANPHAGINVNDDHGWGGHQWPDGVPGELLGTAHYQDISVEVRRELVPLFELALRIADQVGYRIHTVDPAGSGKKWGPWGYENRDIKDKHGNSTGVPSNHSKGKAVDLNAPLNPFTDGFETNMTPEFVSAWESIGLCWGGRYVGDHDFMHFEYGFRPEDVGGHVAAAQGIVDGLAGGDAAVDGVLAQDPVSGWVYGVAPGYFIPLDDARIATAVEAGLFGADRITWGADVLVERRRLLTGLADADAVAAGKGIFVSDPGSPAGHRFR